MSAAGPLYPQKRTNLENGRIVRSLLDHLPLGDLVSRHHSGAVMLIRTITINSISRADCSSHAMAGTKVLK